MPNHYHNRLSVIGRSSDVNAFVEAAAGVCATYAPSHPGVLVEPKLLRQSLCYNALYPVPDAIKAQTYSDAGYRWQIENWGVKWEASYIEGPDIVSTESTTVATWYFYSPNGHPYRLLDKLAGDYPALVFFNSWGGEGPARGSQWRFVDVKASNKWSANDWPRWVDEDTDDANHHRDDVWENAALDVHNDLVGAMVELVNGLSADLELLCDCLYLPVDPLLTACLCVADNNVVSAYALDHFKRRAGH